LFYNQRILKVFNLTGIFCLFFSIIYLPAIYISLYYVDHETKSLLEAFIVCIAIGLCFWLPTRKNNSTLNKKEGFLIVVLFWIFLSVLGALPFIFSLDQSIVNALFESVSGLTTTGATIMSGLDKMPPSILFFRQELQWFGGIGLVVLAVAVIPQLGIGGMSIYKAEVPGPMKEEKFTPRLMQSSKIIVKLYLGMTLVCALCYWAAGMSLFDAVAHSLSTVSTGGFSTHDRSLGYFESTAIEAVATVFMLLGAINFNIHYLVLRKKSLKPYIQDIEVKTFLIIVVVFIVIAGITLYWQDYNPNLLSDLHFTVFEVASVITSTGFGNTEDFTIWPLFLPLLFIMMSFIGGCGGSTAGGMKVLRVLILGKLIYREILKLIHPNGIISIKLRSNVIPERILHSIFGYFSLYAASFVLLLLLIMATGVDQITAFSAIATCMNNLGPGLGDVSSSFSSLNDGAKALSIVAMLLGRLEIISVLVLFAPDFWRS